MDYTLKDVLDVLEGMVCQHCTEDRDGKVDSGALGANAYAMEILANYGRFVIDRQIGRMVVGRWTEKDGSEEVTRFGSLSILCPDCDHGLRGGQPCQSCGGSGWSLAEVVKEAPAAAAAEDAGEACGADDEDFFEKREFGAKKIEDLIQERDRLLGEVSVLRHLLRDAAEVLAVIDSDGLDENESMLMLGQTIARALAPKHGTCGQTATAKSLPASSSVTSKFTPCEADRDLDRILKIEQAAKLACGLLWMCDTWVERIGKVQTAYAALRDALGASGSKGLGEAIKIALDAGHQVDPPEGFEHIEWH